MKFRRLTAAVVGGGAALVVFAAMPANAAVTPVPVVPPVAPIWRSSELAALAGKSSLADAVGGITATEGAGAGAATAAGAAFAPVGVAIAGAQAIQGTSWVMHTAFHMGTGSFVCDVQTLFDANSPCSQQGAPTGYVANSDVIVTPAGWAGGNYTIVSTSTYHGSTQSYTSGPGYSLTGSATGPAVGTAGTVTMTITAPTGSSDGANYFAVVVADSGSCGSGFGGQSGYLTNGTTVSFSVAGGSCVYHWQLSGGSPSGPWIMWYPVGHVLRPPAQNTNPTRTLTTTWTCADGSSGSATSASFTETDTTWPEAPAATCPVTAGPVATATTTENGGPGSKTVSTVDASGVSTAFAGQSTQCASGGCTLDLVRIDPTTGTRLDCFAGAEACAQWWTETQQGTASGTQYDCTYGGVSVALTECTVLAHAFDQGVYSDPRTGEPAPDAPPAAEPGSTTCPPPFSWSGLFSSWWAFKATACALQEAFVPSAATATDWQTFVGDVQTHPPVSMAMGGVQFTNDVIAGVNGQGDCSSLPLQMADQQLQGPTATFDLCAGVKQAAATTWGQAVELVVTIAIIGWAAWIVMHRIGRSFGSKA